MRKGKWEHWFLFSLPSFQALQRKPTTLLGIGMDNPQQIKILVVEDDLSSRIIMEAILSKLGYQVCATDSGIHAIDLLKKTPFDVVLMDLVMPEIGGYETTLRIRREHTNGFHPNIPILALTADSTSDTLRQCQEIGMNGCLTKPVNPATLPLFIRQCLDGAQWVTPIKSDDQPLDDPYSSHPESMDLPTLDWNMTLRNVGGDASRARTILSIGLEDLPPLLHRLAHAFQAGDYRQAKL
ncbi:MAG: response regulator, partial [Candidatus Omnitrophica bacterium]|nr:response regulator [Candidatus Omnitrophota bacterium]